MRRRRLALGPAGGPSCHPASRSLCRANCRHVSASVICGIATPPTNRPSEDMPVQQPNVAKRLRHVYPVLTAAGSPGHRSFAAAVCLGLHRRSRYGTCLWWFRTAFLPIQSNVGMAVFSPPGPRSAISATGPHPDDHAAPHLPPRLMRAQRAGLDAGGPRKAGLGSAGSPTGGALRLGRLG